MDAARSSGPSFPANSNWCGSVFIRNPGYDLRLFVAGRITAAGGQVVSSERARRINALMLTCGHYDGSGDFAFRVGLPGKSGVGGGILAVAPMRASIAVWSPGLNKVGNSLLGSKALEQLAKATGWSVFGDR
jgi:glutaminase